MTKPFQVQVFGKAGCDKCKVLNERLDKLLAREEWEDFEKCYFDVETEEGMILFCESECINPQHIPAMVVARHDAQSDGYKPVPNPHPGKADSVCKKSKLYQYLGLRTDYSEAGKGVLTPKMISSVLAEAKA